MPLDNVLQTSRSGNNNFGTFAEVELLLLDSSLKMVDSEYQAVQAIIG